QEIILSPLFRVHAASTTQTYTLSLHDALPISQQGPGGSPQGTPGSGAGPSSPFDQDGGGASGRAGPDRSVPPRRPGSASVQALADRKSTRLNSSHEWISYAVFCLKKKTKNTQK